MAAAMALPMPHMDPPPFHAYEEHEALPSYTEASARRTSSIESASVSPRELTTHTYQLKDSRGQTWMKLSCNSWAKSPKQLPRVVEGEKLNGTVELDLRDPITMKLVKVTVSHLGHYLAAF